MYVVKRIARQKLAQESAEKLHQHVQQIMIVGLVDFIHPQGNVEIKNKAKLDFFSKMELAEIAYLHKSKADDIVEETATPLISTLQKRIAKTLEHEKDAFTMRVNMLTENLYADFLTEKLIPMESLIVKAGKSL